MRWLAGLLVVACSSGPGAPTHPQQLPPGVDGGQVAAGPDAQQCDALLAHAIELEMEHQRATRPAAEVPTDEDRAALRAKLGGLADECRTLTREDYACAIAAASTAAMVACQPTRNSSTSNSKVAPGGITPAAPRSP